MKFYLWRNWSGGQDFGANSTYRAQLLLSPSSSRKSGAPAVIEDRLFLQ
jgi:hypothetical protein